jgi:hypothetical protein
MRPKSHIEAKAEWRVQNEESEIRVRPEIGIGTVRVAGELGKAEMRSEP